MPTSPRRAAVRAPRPDSAAQLREIGYHPLAAAVLATRGFAKPEDIAPGLPDLAVPDGSPAHAAARLVAAAIEANERICVIGDYDADGVCATALAKLALDSLGADARWLLSDPDYDERSLDPALVDRASQDGAKLIVTVDGGVSAHPGAARAKELGVRVVVTDHHPPEDGKVVDAAAVVNPHLEGCGLPAAEICGTAVAYILFKEVFRLRASEHSIDRYLDLVAVATMTDVMPLDQPINRGIAIAGIDRIRKRRCRPAIQAMIGRDIDFCPFRDLNFRIGPMLNSARRMHRTEIAMQALLANDIGEARALANELKATNRDRRIKSQQMLEDALALLAEDGEPGAGIVLHSPAWDAGLVGITASQLAGRHGVPAAVLCSDDVGTRGSMRSTAAVPLDMVMEEVCRADSELVQRWGGHRAAAGVRLRGPVERFRELFAAACAKHGGPAAGSRDEIAVDAEPSLAELGDGSIEQFDDLPWGKEEMPAPLFVNTFRVISCQPTRARNGYNYRLGLEGAELFGWGREDLEGEAEARLVYATSLDSRNDGDLPFVAVQARLPA